MVYGDAIVDVNNNLQHTAEIDDPSPQHNNNSQTSDFDYTGKIEQSEKQNNFNINSSSIERVEHSRNNINSELPVVEHDNNIIDSNYENTVVKYSNSSFNNQLVVEQNNSNSTISVIEHINNCYDQSVNKLNDNINNDQSEQSIQQFVENSDDSGAEDEWRIKGFADLPVEIVEYILSLAPDPISQRRFSQVSLLWRESVLRLRWLRLLTFERRVHLRLPLAGSFDEKSGSGGFSLLVTVDSPVLLAGVAVFLPHRDKFSSDVSGCVDLYYHGTAHIGPRGDLLASTHFNVSREEGIQWQQDCKGSNSICLQGPWQKTQSKGTLAGGCAGLHPLPVMFEQLVELQPLVRYLLSLRMVKSHKGSETSEMVGTVWGFQGVPRRQTNHDQNHFRWYQVYRAGLSSSVSSGQFPILYYIS